MKNLVAGLVLICFTSFTFGQITINNTTLTPTQLVTNVLAGTGVQILNVTFNNSAALATNPQVQVGYFNNNGTSFPLAEGVILGTGNTQLSIGPNNSGSSTNNTGVAIDPNDPDLNAIITGNANDECVLEFDFIPNGDTIVFNYIFASEEYHEYSTSQYNDAFGFFISGPGFAGPYSGGAENIAIIPGTNLPVTMNNLNNGLSNTGPCVNCAFLVDNANGQNIQYDARTVVLQAAASVQCGQTYHIKLAIGDVIDTSLDSGVFLEASSFTSNGVSVNIASATGSAAITEACDSAIVSFIRPPEGDSVALTIPYGIGGTATNGVDYNNLSGSVTFPVGVDTVQFYITPTMDGLTEGIETVELSVTIVNACGDTITTNATVEITDPLPYSIITSDTTINCPNDSINISITTSGGINPIDFSWNNGGTGNSIWVPGNNVGTTSYTVNATDACGVNASGTVNVTLSPAPQPTITFNDDDVVLCPGQQFNFIATVNNPYNPSSVSYNWNPQVSNSNQINITAPNTILWEYLTVFDGCYTVTDSVKITPGGVTINSINTTNATSCPAQSSFVGGTIEILPNGYTYTLTGGGNSIGPQSNNNFSNLAGNLNYSIHIVDANGCFSDTIVYVGSDIINVSFDWVSSVFDSVTCFGFQDGSAAINNIQGGLNNGPYDVSWTHSSGDFTTVNGISSGSGNQNDTLYGGQWIISVVEPGSGCAADTVFTIFEPNKIVVDTSNYSIPTCFGYSDGSASINVVGGNSFVNYVLIAGYNSNGDLINSNTQSPLTLNNLSTDIYTIYVEDVKGCFDSVNIFINQPAELLIDFSTQDIQCNGVPSGLILVDTVYNYQYATYANISYDWTPNPPSGIEGVGANLNNHLPPGNYEVKVVDSDGGNECFKTFEFTIFDAEPIEFNEIAALHKAICRSEGSQNGHGQIYAEVTGGLTTSGNGNLFSTNSYWENLSTGQIHQSPTWGNLNPGYYTYHAINDIGCIKDSTIFLDSINPIANFNATSPQFSSNYIGTAPVVVALDNTSQYYSYANDPVYNTTGPYDIDTLFEWRFSESSTVFETESLEPIIHTYLTEGLYTVCLTVIENLNKCIDSTCIEIQIYDKPSLIAPNIFTPDGDGINDYFFFPNQAIIEFNAVLLDRWGKIVFKFDDINTKWDGTNMNNGKPCSDGTYFYNYEGESSNGTKYKGQGTVQILNSKK